jgi:uracil-DNA glycosylase
MAKPDFNTLTRKARACRLCEADLPFGPRPVFQMHPAAAILIAGQAPGRRVHESRTPFDDPSGERLRDWMGIDRETFYDPRRVAILPMGFCYLGTAGRAICRPAPNAPENGAHHCWRCCPPSGLPSSSANMHSIGT